MTSLPVSGLALLLIKSGVALVKKAAADAARVLGPISFRIGVEGSELLTELTVEESESHETAVELLIFPGIT